MTMLLRPFYPVEVKLSNKIKSEELVRLLVTLPSTGDTRKKVLENFNVRELLILLNGLSKDDNRDEFYNFDELDTNLKSMWIDVVDVLNRFPCVKLVDTYSKLSDQTSNASTLSNNDGIDWYELAIDSNEYDFLLEYLIDMNVNRINFKLIEINTKKFNKIYEVLENHCSALKIQNDNLSVIKDSENFKLKLKILTLSNYEYFETVEKLNYETLNIIGNEVDIYSVSTLIKKNKNLKVVYFKGRLKDYIPLNIDENIRVYYDLIVFDTIDKSQLKGMGNLARFNELYLNLTLETNITIDWLENCYNLKKLYFSLNFNSTQQHTFSNLNSFPNLEELTIKRCDVLIRNDETHPVDNIKNIMPKLKLLTLIECNVDTNFFKSIDGSMIYDIFLVNCNLKFDSFIKLSRNIRNLTIINQDVNQCKDFVFLTYKVRSTYLISNSRRCILNINEKLMTLKIPESHDIYFTKLGAAASTLPNHVSNGDTHLRLDNLKIPYNSTLNFTVYPNFSDLDFGFLRSLVWEREISFINIELYSFTNIFYKIYNVDGIENLKTYCYDVFKLQENLRRILAKKELTNAEKHFVLPYPSSKRDPALIMPGTIDAILLKMPRKSSIYRRGLRSGRSKYRQLKLASSDTGDSDEGYGSKVGYICKVCGKRFPRNTSLNRHLLVHRNYRPFRCDRCGYRFKRSDHLKAHNKACVGK